MAKKKKEKLTPAEEAREAANALLIGAALAVFFVIAAASAPGLMFFVILNRARHVVGWGACQDGTVAWGTAIIAVIAALAGYRLREKIKKLPFEVIAVIVIGCVVLALLIVFNGWLDVPPSAWAMVRQPPPPVTDSPSPMEQKPRLPPTSANGLHQSQTAQSPSPTAGDTSPSAVDPESTPADSSTKNIDSPTVVRGMDYHPVRIDALTAGKHELTSAQQVDLAGLLKEGPCENPRKDCEAGVFRFVPVDLDDDGISEWVVRLLADCERDNCTETLVARRQGQWWALAEVFGGIVVEVEKTNGFSNIQLNKDAASDHFVWNGSRYVPG